jgi:purine-binding chemotaxis protein CheW
MDKPTLTVESGLRISPPPTDDTSSSDTFGQGSVCRLVAFRLEGQRYALHLPLVERILHMVAVSPLPRAPGIVLGVINFHGQVIPVLDLQRRLGLSSRNYSLSSTLLVARTNRRALAFPVDEVLGVQEVTEEIVTLPPTLCPGIGLLVGIAALPDGLLFIHDLDAFLSLDEEQRLTESLEGHPE